MANDGDQITIIHMKRRTHDVKPLSDQANDDEDCKEECSSGMRPPRLLLPVYHILDHQTKQRFVMINI